MIKKKILLFSLFFILRESTFIGFLRYILIKFLNKFSLDLPIIKFKKNNKKGIIILGCGEYALSIHLPILRRIRKEISGISSRNLKNLKHISQIYQLDIYKNFEVLLKESNFDSILISTPPYLHPYHLLDCIDKGVYIYLEKPVAINYEGLEVIYKNVLKHPNCNKIMVGFNRRYSESIKKLKNSKWLKNRSKPLEIEYRVNFGKINDNKINDRDIGGGRLHSVACHFIDLICYLVNTKVKRISAFSVDENNNTFSALLKFEDESIASLIFTSEGDRYFKGKEIINITAENHNALLIDFESLTIDNKKYSFHRRNYGAYNTMLEFLKCKNNSLDTSISLKDGIYATQITLAIEESICLKKIIDL